jgi:hypothetical protein
MLSLAFLVIGVFCTLKAFSKRCKWEELNKNRHAFWKMQGWFFSKISRTVWDIEKIGFTMDDLYNQSKRESIRPSTDLLSSSHGRLSYIELRIGVCCVRMRKLAVTKTSYTFHKIIPHEHTCQKEPSKSKKGAHRKNLRSVKCASHWCLSFPNAQSRTLTYVHVSHRTKHWFPLLPNA